MWMQTLFNSLTSTPTRRPMCRRATAARLKVESLDERCLPSFGLPVDYGSDLAPYAVVSGDFNGDGRLDLATANRDDYSVSALLGNGDGTFQAARTSGSFSVDPTTFRVADLNSDGNDDLLTVSFVPYDYNVSLLLANGDGTFQPPQSITPSGSVALGDFNGDGHIDLVVGRSDFADVLLGNGDGTFHRAAVLSGAGNDYRHAGDFNNDGNLDLVNVYGVLPGNGDGTFRNRVSGRPLTAGVTQPAGDFNGDGNLDLLSDGQGGPFLQLGNGDGTFRQVRYLDGNYLEHSTVAGDVNADGNLDVVVLTPQTVYDEYGYPIVSTPAARVLVGRGDGSFAQPLIAEFGVTHAGLKGFTFPVLADFDGDGRRDLAATQVESSYSGGVPYSGVHVMLNDPNWTPPPPPPPYITIGPATIVTEGNIGTTAAAFTVTLSKSWDQPVSVAYATSDGDAIAGSDYQAVSGTLTIPAGQTTGTIIVPVIGDRLFEGSELFFVILSPIDATIGEGHDTGWVFIHDDEPRIGISDVTKDEGKKGQTTLFTFTVTLSAAYDQPVTLSFRTADGNATTGNNDYVTRSGTLTFLPGETAKTITIEVKGDTKKEATEYFYLDLFGNSTNSLFTKTRGTGTILNDD